MKHLDVQRILFDAQRRGVIPQPVMHRFPPLAIGDLDPRRITEVDEDMQVIRVFVWTSEPRPELARAYFDVIARHLEGTWELDVLAMHGDPADRTAQITQRWFPGPAAPVPARLLPIRPLQPAVPA
ncbi:hypothetical protein ABZ897_16100 [Nonomuraea sp. NPDC046802]|uniref:hypothetical protein n=1 Tax=Nonomuraea sp. NPDC046802 TaxID=3154919 RepID=UPI0033C58539